MKPFGLWQRIVLLVVIAFGVVWALPNIARDLPWPNSDFAPGKRLSLGVDLRGGAYILLEMETSGLLIERAQGVTSTVREVLRTNRWRVSSLSLIADDSSASGNTSSSNAEVAEETQAVRVVLLPSVPVDSFLREVREALGPDLDVVADQSSGLAEITIRYTPDAIDTIVKNALNLSIETIRKRIDETGTTEPVIQQQGFRRIAVQMPGVTDPERVRGLIGTTAKLSFHLVNQGGALTGRVPADSVRLPSSDEYANDYVVFRAPIVSGESLQDASATFEEGRPIVNFRFDTEGARRFGKATSENVGRLLAIVLDDQIISAPRIQSAIQGGSGIITGNFTVDSANDLALLLRSGALPAPMEIVEERTVGPSLGADSIRAGVAASLIGFALVLVFMSLWYGRFGIIASVVLLVNIVLLVALLSLLQATLTLPGIAGIVLTIGMAVDANVLVFERIREERATASSFGAAIDAGFARAFGTIMDANLTTLLATIILYATGSGPIRGFAVTLSFGIICSLFTALLLTRFLLATTTPRAQLAGR
ncbi:MAG: protein translocase subunit SecD [Alphaproteobacteria bacterium]|nr:protein translocase subunit SecD [Alphaproteobacteria bacterium]